ncbi:hypothetical protein chiPu_0027168, partial [Chiloscyllium punctatum]|nr:hypothetical protein [Chiloscyllium punctatum]
MRRRFALLRLDAGRLDLRRPAHDLAFDEGAELGGRQRCHDHPDIGELLPGLRHREVLRALRMDLVDDGGRRAGRREQPVPDRGLEARHGFRQRGQAGGELVAGRRRHCDAAQRAALHLRDRDREIAEGQVDHPRHHVGHRLRHSAVGCRDQRQAAAGLQLRDRDLRCAGAVARGQIWIGLGVAEELRQVLGRKLRVDQQHHR